MAIKEASNLLDIANSEIAFQNSEKEKRAVELIIANKELAYQNSEKEKRANELLVANKKLVFENEEKVKRAAELEIANKELAYQNSEKEKRAEELLLANKELAFLNKQQQALFASIVNSSEDAIVSLTLEGIITSWNIGAEKIFGYNANEIIGKSILTLIPPSLQNEEWDILKKIREGKTVDHFNTERLRKDGTIFYASLTISSIQNFKGEIIGASKILRDITLEKQKEQHLKLLESVITNTTDAVVITEAEPLGEPGPRILFVNDAFTKMTGYSANEVLGKTPRILQGPKTDKNELKRLGEAIRKWETYETTLINYKKNGEEFWINFKLTPVANEKGWYTHFISIERDVTEQKLIELKLTALVKELADYKFALDQSSIVAVTDQRGIIKHVNDNFTAISKYSQEELIGQDHRIINSGYHDSSFIQNLWATIANGKIWKGELKNKAKDGSIYWVNTTIVPFLNNDGKPYQYIAIRNDITERHKHQITIENKNTKLRDIAWTESHILRAPVARMLGLLNIMEMEDFKSDDTPQLMTHFKNSLHELDDVIMEIVQKTQSLDL